MKHSHWTRREFLTSLSAGAATLFLPAPASMPGSTADRPPFTFVQICDTQLGFGGYEHDMASFEQAVHQVNALQPEFVVICGDLVNTANDKSFADFNRIKAKFKVPCHCAAGNHDIGNKPTLASLQHYRKVVGRDYYAFERNGCEFVVVNTQLWKTPVEEESEKHDAWLVATLAGAAQRQAPTFIIGHHPLFIKTLDEAEGYYSLPVAKRRALLALFEKTGVVAVLGGHTHKLLINGHKGIQLVNGETTSKNFDKRPFGYRLWRIGNTRPFPHEFVPLGDQ